MCGWYKRFLFSILLLFPNAFFWGCQPPDFLAFPDSFVLGTSISGFQGDMGCPTLSDKECNDTQSDWYQWIASPQIREKGGIYHSGDPLSMAPGQWELFPTDYVLAKEKLGIQTYRMGIEWSRIFPQATFAATTHEELKKLANPKALETYRKMFSKLREIGVEPYVTLSHYTLPLWIHDGVTCHLDYANCKARGWAEPEKLIQEIGKFAGFVAKEFGDQVDYWIPLNEPVSAIVLPAYLFQTEMRVNPPAQFLQYDRAKKSFIGQIRAHAIMYKAIKQNDVILANPKNAQASLVGIAHSMVPVYPKDPSNALDKKAAENMAYILNELFLKAIIEGKLDENLDGTTKDEPGLVGLDFIGLNYYQKLVVKGHEKSQLPELSPLATLDLAELILTGFASYDPQGIYDLLKWLKKYNMPIYITENGHEMKEKDGKFDDSEMSTFMVRHLFWVQQAIEKENVPVAGYFYWSFLDNYEWNHGMKLRFGLFTWDPQDTSKKRIPRKAVATFLDISTRKHLSKEFLFQHLTADEKKRLPEHLQTLNATTGK